MKKYNYVLAIDPSGNFHEGKGTTGYCLLDANENKIIEYGYIPSSDFDSIESYWYAHIKLLNRLCTKSTMLVIEDYLLYGSKKDNQINSRMETPKLIGALQLHCYKEHIDYILQPASEVKNRWTDEILDHKGYFCIVGTGTKINGKYISKHTKDAIRHAVHFNTFKNN